MVNHAEPTPLITRGEILNGFVQRRAWNLLFMLENRTAYHKASAPRITDLYITEEILKKRELIYLQSFSQGKQPPIPVTIQDIEHYLPQSAFLIPEAANVRAALAHLLGQKYRFTRESSVNLRAGLGLDEAAVQDAYQRLYHQPLETIYQPVLNPGERLAWAWDGLTARIENLPPFWAVYSMSLTETVGAGILALPLALAGVGPLGGALVLILLGLVNLLTLAFAAETISRSGAIRHGQAFVGTLIQNLISRRSSILFGVAMFVDLFFVLEAYMVGFGTALETLTHIPAGVWLALLCGVTLYIVGRKLLNATVALALLVGTINIGIILFLGLLTTFHFQPANLDPANLPLLSGRPFDPLLMASIFGMVMEAYFGHLTINTTARLAIRRDPSCRSLFWGAVAAQATAMGLYVIWIFVVNGAIPAQELLRESGTVLAPLAKTVGVFVPALGTIFVVLSMGLGVIMLSMSLFGLVAERIPTLEQLTLNLPRRQGKMVLVKKGQGELRIELSYLGISAHAPQLRLDLHQEGRTQHIQVGVKEGWQLSGLSKYLSPSDLATLRLKIDVLEFNLKSIRLRFDTNLEVSYAGEWDPAGLSMAQVLELSPAQQKMITWMARERHVTVAAVAAYLNEEESAAREILGLMAAEGLVSECEMDGECQYQVLWGFTRKRSIAGIAEPHPADRYTPVIPPPAWKRWIARNPGRTLVALGPIFLAFALAGLALLSGSFSFSGILGFVGVVTAPILGGVYPVLMLAASRRKGEFVPQQVYRLLGHPALLVVIFLITWMGPVVYIGLWQNIFQRAGALTTALLMLALPVLFWKSGAFRRRLVARVIVKEENNRVQQVSFATVAAGKMLEADVQLRYPTEIREVRTAAGDAPLPDELREVIFNLPDCPVDDLLVWGLRVSPDDTTTALDGKVRVQQGKSEIPLDLSPEGGRAVIPLAKGECQVKMSLDSDGHLNK
jgi:amino acid permease